MRSLGVRARIVLLTIVPTITISLLLGIYFISMRISDLNRNLMTRGQTMSRELASEASFVLLNKNNTMLENLSGDIKSRQDVISAAIFDADGKLLKYGGEYPDIRPGLFKKLSYLKHRTVISYEHGQSLTLVTPVILKMPFPKNSVTTHKIQKSRLGWVVVTLSKTQMLLSEYRRL